MKKNLILLTGIVFLIAVLVAGGCCNSKKEKGLTNSENETTRVHIYLKDTLLIDGSMHLLMHDSKKPEDVVVDSLETVVYPGDTVVFYKAHKSKVKKVEDIRQIEEVFELFSEIVKVDSGLYVLIIDPYAPDSIRVKYEIDFTVKQDTTIWTIDPYLKIPDQ
ncbi:MAG: hypothetical protein ABFS28_15320 [Bacteroidota bacterium]